MIHSDEALLRKVSLEGQLRLNCYGDWFHNDTPFTHQRLTELFHRSIVYDPTSDSLVLQIGNWQASFTIEDTAYFIVALNDQAPQWTITLKSGQTELLRAKTVHAGSNNALYCTLSNGQRARFSRGVFQQLMNYAVDEQHLLLEGQQFNVTSARGAQA